MDKHKTPYYGIIRSLDQLVRIAKLYKLQHPTLREKLNQVYKEISDVLSQKSINFAETTDFFLVNGEKIQGPFIKSFLESFHHLKLGALDLLPGLTLEEFEIFLHLLYQREFGQGKEKVLNYLKEKGVKHIVPHFASYRLIKETDGVAAKKIIDRLEKLPPEIFDRFLKDFENGKIIERLKKEEKDYKHLAHDPVVLSELLINSIQNKNKDELKDKTEFTDKSSFEQFPKVLLWQIGDYLIDEVDSVAKEQKNRKVIEVLKQNLLSLWEGKVDKENKNSTVRKESIKKTFEAIDTAMHIKGYIRLYQMHEKNLKKAGKRIKKILEKLPPESRLYQKVKESLEKIQFREDIY